MVTETASQFNELLNVVTGGNQILVGGLGVWILGMLTYMTKSLPRLTCEFVKKRLFTETITTPQHRAYYDILAWLEKNGYADKLSKVRLVTEMNSTVKTFGYGTHIVRYEKSFVLITISEDSMAIRTLGNSHKIINSIINNIK